MNGLSYWLGQASHFLQTVNTTWAFDVGSSTTKVVVNGQIRYLQPTCATLHNSTRTLLEVGATSLQSFHRTGSTISTVFPVERGIMVDTRLYQDYLQAVMSQVITNYPQTMSWRKTGAFAVPSQMSPVQQQQLQQVMQQLGLSSLKPLAKTEAIHQLLTQQQKQGRHVFVIDIGGGTTEVAIFFENRRVNSLCLPVGGIDFTQAIQESIRQEYHAGVGWQTAEQLKTKGQLGTFTNDQNLKVTVRVKDLLKEAPATITVNSSVVHHEFRRITQALIHDIHRFLGTVTPEILTQSLEQGVYLTGGGSLLPGLVEFMAQELKCQVIHSPKPHLDVIHGLTAYDRTS